jgi:nitroimidazol reductase NimA-like FMN-containing flavoprotein (pyridoxamine 5'-phosphate oxidase superfamily)
VRRKDREITGTGEILAIIEQCKICRLGLSDNGQAYIVPLNFGYVFADKALTLFFHSAREGRKIDILHKNNRACFEMDIGHGLMEADTACGHSFAFDSVIGFGAIGFINSADEKIRALNILMKHQTGKDIQHSYSEAHLNAVCVYQMNVETFTGKRKTR